MSVSMDGRMDGLSACRRDASKAKRPACRRRHFPLGVNCYPHELLRFSSLIDIAKPSGSTYCAIRAPKTSFGF